MTEVRLQGSGGRSYHVWYWYRVGDAYVGSEFEAKLEQAKQKMLGRADASVVALGAECTSYTCEDAIAVVSDFYRALNR